MYTILIEDLRLNAIIGILDFERKTPQSLTVDCEIVYAKEDEKYVDYAKVSDLIVKILTEGQYFLLEDALDDLIDAIKSMYESIESITVKLTKPEILENCTVSVKKTTKY